MTLLLEGGLVVRQLVPPVVERADIAIDAGRIVADDIVDGATTELVDVSGCLVAPGNVNVHTHAYAALARGMPYTLEAPRTFLEILQRIWWRLDRALEPETIVASALVTARDALLAGTTTIIDHHSSPSAIDGSLDMLAAAFEQVGIRSIVCYEVSDRDGLAVTSDALAENDRFLRRVATVRPALTRAMVGGHAPFTMSTRTLTECAALAQLHEVGLHIHAAEDAVDNGAVFTLHDAGVLDRRTLLAHAVHLDLAEVELIEASEAFVAHNARSNMNNGVGRAPVNLLGPHVGLGTDGIDGDMFEETRAAYFRRRESRTDVAADWAVARLSAGAQRAGRIFGEPLLGTLLHGAPADMMVLEYDPPTPLDADNLAGHLIFGLRSGHVRDVITGGRVVVRERHMTLIDEADLMRTARSAARDLWRRAEATRPHEAGAIRHRTAVAVL